MRSSKNVAISFFLALTLAFSMAPGAWAGESGTQLASTQTFAPISAQLADPSAADLVNGASTSAAVNIPMGYYALTDNTDSAPSVADINSYTASETANQPLLNPKSLSTMASTPSNLKDTDTSLPRQDFIDIASWQSWMKASDFKLLAKAGVKGVCIKLTEGTFYRNDQYAKSFIKWAADANLVLSFYHYSHFTSKSAAVKEAKYFAKYATELGVDKKSVMVNDMEDPDNVSHTTNSVAFKDELVSLGYANVVHYTSQSWLGESAKMKPSKLGKANIWCAQYLYGKPSKNALKNTQYAAWQYSSQMYYSGTSSKKPIDTSIDYTERFTTKPRAFAENKLYANAFITNYGWSGYLGDSKEVGSAGSTIEALQLAFNHPGIAGSVEYTTFSSALITSTFSGWQEYSRDNVANGVVGASPLAPITAFKVRLTGDLASIYNVEYRSFTGGVWGSWVINDAVCGSESTFGSAVPAAIEILQVRLAPKQVANLTIKHINADTNKTISTDVSARPVGTTWTKLNKSISGYMLKEQPAKVKIALQGSIATVKYVKTTLKPTKNKKLQYRVYQGSAWTKLIAAKKSAGTIKKSKKTEVLQVAYKQTGVSGSVRYKTYTKKSGWSKEVKNGARSGKANSGKPLLSIKIRLTGNLAKRYGIKYRVYAAGKWQAWKSNGAATTNKKKAIEAVQIKLTNKSAAVIKVKFVNSKTGKELKAAKYAVRAKNTSYNPMPRKIKGYKVVTTAKPFRVTKDKTVTFKYKKR